MLILEADKPPPPLPCQSGRQGGLEQHGALAGPGRALTHLGLSPPINTLLLLGFFPCLHYRTLKVHCKKKKKSENTAKEKEENKTHTDSQGGDNHLKHLTSPLSVFSRGTDGQVGLLM